MADLKALDHDSNEVVMSFGQKVKTSELVTVQTTSKPPTEKPYTAPNLILSKQFKNLNKS